MEDSVIQVTSAQMVLHHLYLARIPQLACEHWVYHKQIVDLVLRAMCVPMAIQCLLTALEVTTVWREYLP
jgi:hypothetical protein